MSNETIARQKARCYDTEYSEDFTMSDMLSRPQDFNKQSIKDVYLCLKEKHYRDGYLDGMEDGKPKWHDLRENPNDLPKLEDKRFSWSITVVNQDGKACIYNYRRSCWQTCLFIEIDEPIKWCELPKFEE